MNVSLFISEMRLNFLGDEISTPLKEGDWRSKQVRILAQIHHQWLQIYEEEDSLATTLTLSHIWSRVMGIFSVQVKKYERDYTINHFKLMMMKTHLPWESLFLCLIFYPGWQSVFFA